MSKQQQEQRRQSQLKNNNSFIRYSGLAFEMVIIISAGVFGGIKLDEVFNTKPLLTAFLSLAGVIVSIYTVIKGLPRK